MSTVGRSLHPHRWEQVYREPSSFLLLMLYDIVTLKSVDPHWVPSNLGYSMTR